MVSLGTLTVDEEGCVTLPKELYEEYGWELEDGLLLEVIDKNIIIHNVDFLLRCNLGGA